MLVINKTSVKVHYNKVRSRGKRGFSLELDMTLTSE